MELQDSAIPFVESTSNTLPNQELQAKNTLEFQQKNIYTLTQQDLKERYLKSKKTFVIAFSGGKDSTCVLQLFYEMLLSLPKNLRRPSFAIVSNTLVEAPHIERFLKSVIDSIHKHAKANDIAFEILQVSPSLKDDFWVNLIGKG